MSERFDVAVVGGGIVGLATLRALLAEHPGLRLAVLEKEARLAAHQTGHNSGVIHSGIYYKPGSHKARLCVEGARLMKEFCAKHGIRVDPVGKVIVATSEAELPRLQALLERGTQNGVEELALLDAKGLRAIEPHAAGLRAIHSPTTAIVDYGEVAQALARELLTQGAVIRTGARVTAIHQTGDGLALSTASGRVDARWLVNCAGLYSDVVARLGGARPEVRIIPFRGEYYMIRPERHHLVRGLIYPVPDPTFPFLGGGRRAKPAHRLPGAWPERDPALQRRGHHVGEQRRLGRERIASGVVGWPPPPADQEPPHAAVEPREQRRDVGIGRRR
jgi:(S)-2-hydroxyglutarate dehydrogenase